MVAVCREVQSEVRRRFPRAAQAEVLQALTDLPEPSGASPEWSRARARVQLAIIVLAAGDLERLRSAVAQARLDWRDTLCAAGLEQTNWAEVLRASGYAVPK